VCGDTLFFLAHQGREFVPGKFTGIDRMTASSGNQDLCWAGFRSLVEVIFAACQKPVVSPFEFQQWGGFRTFGSNVPIGEKPAQKRRFCAGTVKQSPADGGLSFWTAASKILLPKLTFRPIRKILSVWG
jgi:hypothetical protein